MTGTLFSLIALVIGFTALIVWVYSPSRKQELNDTAKLVFDDPNSARRESKTTEKDDE